VAAVLWSSTASTLMRRLCVGHRHLPGGHFLPCAPTPPLPYPAAHFDVIYCLSVFTHLDERMQDAWLAELDRILEPGGVLLLTVYSEAATGVLGADGQEMLRDFGFVHKRSSKLRGLLPDWYQTTFHSREYMVRRLSQWFSGIQYFAVPGGEQNVVTARKVPAGVLLL